jgi:hypothetical protein
MIVALVISSPAPQVVPAPEAYGKEATFVTPVPSNEAQVGPVALDMREILSTAIGGCVPMDPSQRNENTKRCVVPAAEHGNENVAVCHVL